MDKTEKWVVMKLEENKQSIESLEKTATRLSSEMASIKTNISWIKWFAITNLCVWIGLTTKVVMG